MREGKIKMKELINKSNDTESKECICFEYHLEVENEQGLPAFVKFYFERIAERSWKVKFISEVQKINECKAYSYMFDVPTKSMSLEMIAAFGLRTIQYVLKEELNYKSMIDFCIGDVVRDM